MAAAEVNQKEGFSKNDAPYEAGPAYQAGSAGITGADGSAVIGWCAGPAVFLECFDSPEAQNLSYWISKLN